MANTGFKGLSVRQTGSELVFRSFLQNSSGALIVSGTTTLKLYEIQSDGTIKTYDFSTNTFVTTTVTTLTENMVYQKANNGAVDTGLWTYSLSTLTGFTVGAVYEAHTFNSGASPTDQMREFQYGSAEGDIAVTPNGAGAGCIKSDVEQWLTVAPQQLGSLGGIATTGIRTGTCQAGSTSSTIVLDAGTSTYTDFQDCTVTITSGTGVGQSRALNGWNALSQTGTIFPNWTTTPDNTSVFELSAGTQVDVGNWLNVYVKGTTLGTPIVASDVMEFNRATAGSNNTITLNSATASTTDGSYVGSTISLETAPGAVGFVQNRTIISYVGSTKVATVDRNWLVNPANLSVYTIHAANNPALNSSLAVSEVVLADTTTNLTNAPTTGDFTAIMKTSLNAATPASIQSVTNIVNGGAINTNSGKVSEVALVDTTNNVINAPTAGDFTAIMKTSLNAATPSLGSTAPAGWLNAAAFAANALIGQTIGLIANAVDTSQITAGAANMLADFARRRTQADVESSSYGDALNLRSAYGQIQQSQNWSATVSPGSITVYKTDGVTILGTLIDSTSGSALPIVGAH